jgi:hypothetical protein
LERASKYEEEGKDLFFTQEKHQEGIKCFEMAADLRYQVLGSDVSVAQLYRGIAELGWHAQHYSTTETYLKKVHKQKVFS